MTAPGDVGPVGLPSGQGCMDCRTYGCPLDGPDEVHNRKHKHCDCHGPAFASASKSQLKRLEAQGAAMPTLAEAIHRARGGCATSQLGSGPCCPTEPYVPPTNTPYDDED